MNPRSLVVSLTSSGDACKKTHGKQHGIVHVALQLSCLSVYGFKHLSQSKCFPTIWMLSFSFVDAISLSPVDVCFDGTQSRRVLEYGSFAPQNRHNSYTTSSLKRNQSSLDIVSWRFVWSIGGFEFFSSHAVVKKLDCQEVGTKKQEVGTKIGLYMGNWYIIQLLNLPSFFFYIYIFYRSTKL